MKKIKTLTTKEIATVLLAYPEWKLDAKETKLSRTFEFEKQIDGLLFIARSTVNAEIVNHHPDITFTYLKVKMVLTTHDAKGLTKNDIDLLHRIEKVHSGLTVDKK